MINQIGAYSLYICLFASVYLIFKSYISSKNFDKKKSPVARTDKK